MVEKHLISHAKSSSFDNFNNAYSKRKNADILFFDCKLDEFQNICLSFNSDLTPKVVVNFSQLLDLNFKIVLHTIFASLSLSTKTKTPSASTIIAFADAKEIERHKRSQK